MTGFTPEEWRTAARVARRSIFTEGNPDLADAWDKAADQAEAHLIPAGGMALTAEQVEDVRTVAWYTGAGLSRAPMAEIHRLRALFPATEPAEKAEAAIARVRAVEAEYLDPEDADIECREDVWRFIRDLRAALGVA